MTNGHVLEKPSTRAKIVAWVLEGKTDSEIAALVSTKTRSVTKQAICKFRQRHQDLIAPAVEQVERQITDYAIASKVNRIKDAQLRRDLLDRVRELRAAGGDGMETGIVARQYKMIGSGEKAKIVAEYKVDTAFLAEWRANDRAVAEELAQLPKPETNITVDNRQIIVRYIEGPDGSG